MRWPLHSFSSRPSAAETGGPRRPPAEMDCPSSSRKRLRADLLDDSSSDLQEPPVSQDGADSGLVGLHQQSFLRVAPPANASFQAFGLSFPSVAWPLGSRSVHRDQNPAPPVQPGPRKAAWSGNSGQSRWGHLASTVRSWFPSFGSHAIPTSPSGDADGGQVPFPPRAADGVAALEMEVGLAPFQPPSPPLPAVPSPPDPHSSRSTRERL